MSSSIAKKSLRVGIAALAAATLGLAACSSTESSTDSDKKSTTSQSETAAAETSEASATKEAEKTEDAGGYGDSEEMTEGEKANEAFENKVTDAELLAGLKAGGHVIFIRHGQTNKDWADQASPDLDLQNCATQRSLSEKGWQQGRMIGAAFKKAEIPVGEVTASEYCRAWQTADLAFGMHKKDPALNFAKAEEYTDAQVKQMADGIKPYLTTKPGSQGRRLRADR